MGWELGGSGEEGWYGDVGGSVGVRGLGWRVWGKWVVGGILVWGWEFPCWAGS